MTAESYLEPMEGLVIRSFEPTDQPSVVHLYNRGLLAGQLSPNDTGADIDNVHEAYFSDDRHHLWIAELDERAVGMVAVAMDEDHTAEIRRLRVEPDQDVNRIAALLLETAINHCKHHRFLKVRLDTQFERSDAVEMFDRIGFQHTRTKSLHDKELLEFYLDIYREPKGEEEEGA